MIGTYFNAIFSFFSRILNVDFGLGMDLSAVILAFFILLAFIRFFVKPILGASLTAAGHVDRKPTKKEK